MAYDVADVIGAQTTVRGTISGDAPLLVRGRVEGSVKLDAHLFIAPEGTLDATVEAREVTVEGTCQGRLVASERIVLKDGCDVRADLCTPALVIEDGARVSGQIEMDVALPAGVEPPTAPR